MDTLQQQLQQVTAQLAAQQAQINALMAQITSMKGAAPQRDPQKGETNFEINRPKVP